MKKIIISAIGTFLLALLCPGNLLTLNAEENKVSTQVLEAYKLAGGWEVASSYVPEGILAEVPGTDTVGNDAWSHKVSIPNDDSLLDQFTITGNETISFEFSVNYFDDDGNSLVSSNNSSALDLYVLNAKDNSQLAMLRIWTDSAGGTNGSHSYELYGSDWNAYAGGNWIAGDARLSSRFFIQFDKENLFSSYVGGSTEITRLDTMDNAYLAERKAAFQNVEALKFQIGGDNGWTKTCSVILRSVNNQSLANEDGMIVDTIAPKFKNIAVSNTLNQNESYTIPEEAYDLFGGITYSLKINETILDGKTFTPEEEGILDVTLYAKDLAGNESDKTFQFMIKNDIAKPEIISLPTINGGMIEPFTTLRFNAPEYVDETNHATLQLNIYKDEQLYTTLQADENKQFSYFVPATMEDGTYQFQYVITNSAGSVESTMIDVSYQIDKGIPGSLYLNKSENTLVEYVPEGLRIATSESYTKTSITTLDISYGIDVKFIVNPIAKNQLGNDTNYVNMILINQENPDYILMYRVWVDFSGSDRPTNVYLSTDGTSFLDITDTGWISRMVDGVDNQYHMAFDQEELLCGERLGGMQKVDRADEALTQFFNQAPSSHFILAFETSRLNANGFLNYEMILTSLNGQSLENENGQLNQIENAYLHVHDLPQKAELNETINIKAYAKDLFAESFIFASVTMPDGKEETIPLTNGMADYTLTQLGIYQFKVYTIGSNQQEVSKLYTVSCLSTTEDISVEINGTYQSAYEVNETITILEATYSENVAEKEIRIKKPNGSEISVLPSATFTFDKPGLYTITYLAKDAALPTPNEKAITITINVPDLVKPVISLEMDETYAFGTTITPQISIIDDSEVDIMITLIDSENKTTTLSTSTTQITLDDLQAGSYTLKIVAEDIYGNKSEVVKNFVVTNGSKKGCKGSIGGSLGILLIMGGTIVMITKKRKES